MGNLPNASAWEDLMRSIQNGDAILKPRNNSVQGVRKQNDPTNDSLTSILNGALKKIKSANPYGRLDNDQEDNSDWET